MQFRRAETLAASLFSFVHQSLQQDQISGFCRRWQHQTCVLDGRLYIDGGLVSTSSVKAFTNESVQENTRLLYEDLYNPRNGFPLQYDNLTKDAATVPTVSGANLWPDEVNKRIFLYGGEYYNGQPGLFDLWSYDVLNNSWNRVHPDGSQGQISRASFGAGAVIGDKGQAYYYGGYLSNKSVPEWSGAPLMLNTFVNYDLVQNKWTNTTFGTAGLSQPGRAEGTLQYLPISDSGMLVYFGGKRQSWNGSIEFLDMAEIDIYDIAGGKWYTQTATGDIPQPRSGFCAGTTWAQDQSSHNIYIFGGMDETGWALGDIYILTLPTFQWRYFYPNVSHAVSQHGKVFSSCNVFAGGSQMMIIGGKLTNTSYNDCDGTPELGGQHNLALGYQNANRAEWWQVLPNVTSYEVPWQVTSAVGGGATGGATATQPANGWATSDLGVYFARRYSAVTRTPTRSIPATATATATVSQPPPFTTSPAAAQSNISSGTTNVGAIAGGAVGGAVALIAIILGILLCLRRNRKKQRANATVPQPIEHGARNSAWENEEPHSKVSPSLISSSTPYYSPQGSPPPPPMSENAFGIKHPQSRRVPHWAAALDVHNGTTAYQTYYPPPPIPGTSSATAIAEEDSRHELSGIRSPVALDGTPRLS